MNDVQKLLSSYIVTNVDKDVFSQFQEQILIKYGIAESFLEENIIQTPKSRLRPQLRRYLIDEGLASVGGIVNHTKPKGEHYITYQTGNVIISHVEITAGGRVREAVHRRVLAMGNKLLEPLQLDFFNTEVLDIAANLNIVIMIVHPVASDSTQVAPQDILVVVPFSNWKDYHALISINELLDMYELEELHESDLAWPTLKDALSKRENKTSNGE